ncbi:MAG: peptidase M16 [Beggiatoa sp. IS2]|nr:MAG: peptidase M16 [Beggiatoa sp. IS2]
MKNWWWLWLGLLSSGTWATPVIQHWQTANGARVYFVQAMDLPIVDVQVVFNAGSARDNGRYGIAALTNGLLNEGAGGYSADQIAEQFENVGAQFSNSAGRDTASVSLRSLSDAQLLQPACDLLAILLTRPEFAEIPFKRVQQQMLAGLAYQKQSPATLASNAFYRAIYGDNHPYAISSSGTVETVKTLTSEEVRAFHTRYYVAKNAVVAIVGALERAAAENLANTLVGKLPSGEVPPPIAAVAELSQGQTLHIDYPSTQTSILVGQPGIARLDPDYFTLYVGNHILGGDGLISRLGKDIREQRGLTYSVYSYFVPLRVAGPFSVDLQTRNAQVDTALQLVKKALQDFVEQGPTAAELQQTQRDITGGFPLRIDSNSDIVGYLTVIGFYGLPLDYLDKFNERIEAVTVDKIKGDFKRHLHLDKLIIVTVGSKS